MPETWTILQLFMHKIMRTCFDPVDNVVVAPVSNSTDLHRILQIGTDFYRQLYRQGLNSTDRTTEFYRQGPNSTYRDQILPT